MPLVPFLVFVAIKLAGYTLAARWLKGGYPKSSASVWTVGVTRTALRRLHRIIGVVAGIAYGTLLDVGD